MTASGIILIAEDDLKLRKLYTDALEIAGFSVIAASDGVEALKFLHTVKPKLILLDVMMPNLNGIETCQRARKIVGSEIPIIFLTALDQLTDLQDCISSGGNDYIVKSEGLAAIIKRVAFWMRYTPGHKRLRENRELMLTEVIAEVSREVSAAQLSSETDETVREVSEFIRVARASATDEFGKTVMEKLYLLGYVTGVVEHWAQLRTKLEYRFLDYLSAVLKETGLLDGSEVYQMISQFDDLSADPCFGFARVHGRNDPSQSQSQGADYTLAGLNQFGLVAGNEAMLTQH